MEIVPILVSVGVAVGLILIAVSVRASAASDSSPGCNSRTRFFLVLLRLAIGWQLLVEGIDKVRDENWSSRNYLLAAQGPLAPMYHSLAGGDEFRERLEVTNNALPEPILNEWQTHLQRFQDHYQLDTKPGTKKVEDKDKGAGDKKAEEKIIATPSQKEHSEIILKQQRDQTLRWLTEEKVSIERKPPRGDPVPMHKTVPEWLKELDDVGKRIEPSDTEYRPTAGEDYTKDWHKQIKAALKRGVEKRTEIFEAALKDILTKEQKALGTVPKPVTWPTEWTALQWSDFLVKWGLVVSGVCLIAGLLTRTAALAGALLLLSFFSSMPPLPGLPESPRAEGHYLFINKTLIEAIALLTISTTLSGRWLGIDGLLQFLHPRRWHAASTSKETTYGS